MLDVDWTQHRHHYFSPAGNGIFWGIFYVTFMKHRRTIFNEGSTSKRQISWFWMWMNSFSAFSQGQHRDYLELCYQGGNITCTEEYTYFCVTSEQSEIHKSLPKRLCFSFYLTCFRKLFGLWENVKSQRLTQILWVEEDLCVFVYLQACVCARLCVNLRVCVCVCVRARVYMCVQCRATSYEEDMDLVRGKSDPFTNAECLSLF